MSTVLLDTHVLYWWSSEPERLSRRAARTVESADELAVASISWWELAWLARHERIIAPMPVRSWLEAISEQVRTVGTNGPIAATAVDLPDSFPRDPVDRIIYATAIEHAFPLITKDERLHVHGDSRVTTIW